MRIIQILVAEGDQVRAGQPLAVLEGQEQAKAQLTVAEAQKQAADEQRARKRELLAVERARTDRVQKVRLEMLQNIYRTLSQRVEQMSKVRADLEKAKATSKDLNDFDVALDRLRVEYYRSFLEQEQARADQDSLAKQRAAEDKQLADDSAAARVAEREIALAKAGLDALTILAPSAGRVLEIPAHAGESSTGTLLFLGDLSAMSATAEIDQSDLAALQVGDPALVTIHGQTITGKVTRIGRLIGKNQMASLDPRALQDLRVARVAIRLDSANLASKYVNMQVDVAITPRK